MSSNFSRPAALCTALTAALTLSLTGCAGDSPSSDDTAPQKTSSQTLKTTNATSTVSSETTQGKPRPSRTVERLVAQGSSTANPGSRVDPPYPPCGPEGQALPEPPSASKRDKVVEALLSNRPDDLVKAAKTADMKDDSRTWMMGFAVERRCAKLVQALFDAGMPRQNYYVLESHAIQAALSNYDLETAKVLGNTLTAGKNPVLSDNEIDEYFTSGVYSLDVLKYAETLGFDINRSTEGASTLHYAATFGNVELVNHLLQRPIRKQSGVFHHICASAAGAQRVPSAWIQIVKSLKAKGYDSQEVATATSEDGTDLTLSASDYCYSQGVPNALQRAIGG